ncbi:hypothetical protein [Actinosynnema sp. NPDC020468]|uniref:hypothetical protein n=1 Tax=Actinosynnema sp. NPDC020468 TaxID=3154488 RepID=UPI003400FF84
MLYLGTASSSAIREAMAAGELGQMCTPAEGRAPLPGVAWAADTGCFGNGYPGDERWLKWLERHSGHTARCLFATAPDVVGDSVATLERSLPFLDVIRELGYPPALVAQDGLEPDAVPWDDIDVLFIGGTTPFKLGPDAARLAAEALRRDVQVHMGRVNSGKRWRYAASLGCASVDGTYLAFGPDVNLRRLRNWAV